MRINKNKINKLIVIMLLFFTIITINSSVMGTAYTYVEINNMNDAEIRNMNDKDLDDTMKKFNESMSSNYSNSEFVSARTRVEKEIKRRQEAMEWDPVDPNSIDYNRYEPGKAGESTKVQSIAGNVLRIIRNIGIVVAIIALIIIGMKYMVGSIEQKAEYKKNMIPFIIGVIILASSTTFVSIIYDTTTSVLKSDTQLASEGETKALEFLKSLGGRTAPKFDLYTELAKAAENRTGAAYNEAYFITLLRNGAGGKMEEGYDHGIAHLDSGNIGDIDETISNRRKSYENSKSTTSREYYIGYLLALGDTDCLRAYIRDYLSPY